MKEDAILATNTSSIRLEDLGAALEEPERLLGVHFFNPVAKMPLVEIVHTDETPAGLVEAACAFAARIGKLPLPVTSSPGFLVNRTLFPYLLEAMLMLEEGLAPETVDAAAVAFGMPMGPVTLADTVGLDICLSVARELSKTLGAEIPAALENMTRGGMLGRKSGAGFYVWKNGKPVRRKTTPAPQPVVAKRLIARMVNEAMACLREGVVADADLLDAGLVFGAGFAPFRGGPMHYVKERGREDFLHELKELRAAHGARFTPDPGWEAG
jgi:3-hydroxyacyl-CoA dehydrogenase/enoyl-CoA hydratase/3-hydroxybutyryl-CoA epimerase